MSTIKSSFHETEFTKSSIDYSKISIDENPFEYAYKAAQDFLAESNVDKLVQIKRKHIQYVDPIICNKLLLLLFDKFKNDICVTKVELFSVAVEALGVESCDFFNSLTDKLKLELKDALSQNLGFEVNLDIDKSEMKKLGYKQVEI